MKKNYDVEELKSMSTDELVEIMKGYGYDAAMSPRPILVASIVNEQNKSKHVDGNFQDTLGVSDVNRVP